MLASNFNHKAISFQDNRGRYCCHCFCVELVKRLTVHLYSVDIFSYSGPSGILGSGGKQNIA